MESQSLFNIIIAACGVMGGWILKVIWDAIQGLKNEVRDLTREINQDFVRREDFKDSVSEIKADMREGFREVKEMIVLLSKKLDEKADKSS